MDCCSCFFRAFVNLGHGQDCGGVKFLGGIAPNVQVGQIHDGFNDFKPNRGQFWFLFWSRRLLFRRFCFPTGSGSYQVTVQADL